MQRVPAVAKRSLQALDNPGLRLGDLIQAGQPRQGVAVIRVHCQHLLEAGRGGRPVATFFVQQGPVIQRWEVTGPGRQGFPVGIPGLTLLIKGAGDNW